jgi:flagellin-like hook-associated protein FlgL
MFNFLLKAQAASNSIQAAIELGQKHQADREAMQQEFEQLQHRLESVREQLFRWLYCLRVQACLHVVLTAQEFS